jgi:hypothetical protein
LFFFIKNFRGGGDLFLESGEGKPPLPKVRMKEIEDRIAKKVKKSHPEEFGKIDGGRIPLFGFIQEEEEK